MLAALAARRFVAQVSRRTLLGLALLPLLFTGRAMVSGGIYGPADLYYLHDPWKPLAAENGVAGVQNGILSDLAFANLPWRAAVRESLANGRFPLWNRFVLAGTPLAGSGSAAVFHPSTWMGIFLPVAQSWTFSCTLTLFLSLLCACLYLRDFGVSDLAAVLGAMVWGFSTYMLFWLGWSVGMSTATFPLLLLGLRRIARQGRCGLPLTVAALLLSLAGGHPESALHGAAAGGVAFLWELFRSERGRRGRARALRAALAAGVLGFLLAAPILFPLLEAIPHSAEYRTRRAALASGGPHQSVAAGQALARLLPAILPFSHGIYGKTLVDQKRNDGSGVPLAYSGSLAFAFVLLALLTRSRLRPGLALFLAFVVVGLLMGASAPGLLDLVERLPGFRLALNYRLVFLSALGLAGVTALAADAIERDGRRGALSLACLAGALGLALAFLLSGNVFQARQLPSDFVRASFLAEIVPLLVLAVVPLVPRLSPRHWIAAAAFLFAASRLAEMGGTYPTLPAKTLAPPLPTLAALPPNAAPYRIAATGETLRPNGAALYGFQDVRGYESIVLDRFADTYPLWCQPQFASFNRIDDLTRPFLAFLGVRFAVASAGAQPPAGWRLAAAGREMSLFENPLALPLAFVPRSLRFEPDEKTRLEQMQRASDFSQTVWLEDARSASWNSPENGTASVAVRRVGPDLLVSTDASARTLIATSIPAWPGWRAEAAGRELTTVRVNHAFVGFIVPPGQSIVRLCYRPLAFRAGVWAFILGLTVMAAAGLRRVLTARRNTENLRLE